MPTTTEETDKYFRVIGSELEDDGKFLHKAKQVADYEGTPLPGPAPEYDYRRTAQEIPRGTIIKVTRTVTTTFTLNPTS